MARIIMRTYKSKFDTVQAAKWTGEADVYRFLREWAAGMVQIDSKGKLLLQTANRVEEVPIGHMIVRTEDTDPVYFKVNSEAHFLSVYKAVG